MIHMKNKYTMKNTHVPQVMSQILHLSSRQSAMEVEPEEDSGSLLAASDWVRMEALVEKVGVRVSSMHACMRTRCTYPHQACTHSRSAPYMYCRWWRGWCGAW